MAIPQSGLTFVLDENTAGVLPAVRACRALGYERVTDLPAQGIAPGTLDTDLLRQLGARGRFALLARDGRMLEPLIQRQAWRESGVTVFLLGKSWGNLKLAELSRRLLFLWPTLVEHAEQGGQGVAWRVSPTIPGPAINALRLVTARKDEAGP
jgi:hypothetical protein